MELPDAYLVAVVAAVLVAVAHGVYSYSRTRGRWGETRVPDGETGQGAYRSAPRFTVVMPHAPRQILGAGLLARVWAALTLMVFVPAGGLAVLAFVGLAEETAVSGLLAIVVGGLVLSGLGLSAALVTAAHAVETRALEDAQGVVTWSLVHHGLVAVVFVLEGAAIDPQLAAVALSVVVPVCAVGVGVTLALRAAAERARLDPTPEAA